MSKKDRTDNRNIYALLGESTPYKQAGLAYSINAVLPSVLFILFAILCSALGLMKEGYQKQDWFLYFSYILPQASIALLAAFLLKWSNTPVRTLLQEQKCKPKYFFWAILLQIGLLSLSELNTLFLQFLERFGYEMSDINLPNMDGMGFVFVLVVVAFLPAVFEELLFRYFLLKGLKCFSTAGAVLLCGVLFSLFHQNPAQTAYQFCCGAAFALVAIRSNSILPTTTAHFLNNAVILVLYKFFGESYALPAPFDAVLLAVSAVCLILSLGYLIFIDKSGEKKQGSKAEKKTFLMFSSIGVLICLISWLSVLLKGL